MVEHFHGKEEVAGSIPALGSVKYKSTSYDVLLYFTEPREKANCLAFVGNRWSELCFTSK